MKNVTFLFMALVLSSCVLTDSGVVEYQIVGSKGFVAKYIDEGGTFRDTVVTKESFTYKFLGDGGDKVGASAIPTALNGDVLIKVKYRGSLIADGLSLTPFQPALAFSILK
jgi:hypothetical protein